MTNTTLLRGLLLLLVVSSPMAIATTVATAAAPAVVEAKLQDLYSNWGGELRYFASSIDLNGDGRDEIIVHLVGETLCGSEGCDTLVFTPSDAGFRHVTTIRLTHAPIRVSPRSTNGWRNLIVSAGGDGVRRHDRELTYDGESYPSDPTTIPVRRWLRTATEVVIQPYESTDGGTLLVSR
ncbi:MAG: hypothetical protein ABW292_11235 [Vicinamibacterales bacterium]